MGGENVEYCIFSEAIYDENRTLVCTPTVTCYYHSSYTECNPKDKFLGCGCSVISETRYEFNIQCQRNGHAFSRRIPTSYCGYLNLPTPTPDPSLSLFISPSVTPVIYGKVQTARTLSASVSNNGGRGFRDVVVSGLGSFAATTCGSDSCNLGTFTPDIK